MRWGVPRRADNRVVGKAVRKERAMNICHITVSGRLTDDAKVGDTTSGGHYVRFSLARNRRAHGEEVTEYYSCTWFGEYAAKAAQSLTKGTKVCVEGDFSTRYYERESSDIPGVSLDVRVSALDVLSPRRTGKGYVLPPGVSIDAKTLMGMDFTD
jgi:single-stranded DNA-binding protein